MTEQPPAGGTGASEGDVPARSEDPHEPPDPLDAARDALARARLAARGKGLRPGSPAGRARRRATQTTSPRKDRDPHLVGDEVAKLVASRGWDSEVQVGAVIGRWPAIVGDQVAANVEVIAFEGTVLTVRAGSTAWATQMRLLLSSVLARIEEQVGEGVVTEIIVQGPAGPSWRKGPLSAGGRGPRDTYG